MVDGRRGSARYPAGLAPRLLAVWLVAAALLAAGAPSVLADEAEDAQRAKDQVREGIRLYDEGHFEEALAAFREARALRPWPSHLYSIARCLMDLGRLPEALAVWDEYLEEESDEGERRRGERFRRLTEEDLRKTHAQLEVTSEPPGASVSIDDGDDGDDGDEAIARAPLRTWLPAGVHRLRVVLEGYVVLEDRVTLTAGEDARYVARLVDRRAKGRLVFVDVPEDATVTVGDAPIAGHEMELDPGDYQLRATRAGFLPYEEVVTMPPGGRVEVAIEMKPLAPPEPPETTAPERGFRFRWPAWLTSGIAVAALATGVTFHVLARDRVDGLDGYWDDPAAPRGPWQRKVDDADRDLLVASVLYGVAGAAAIATGVILLVDNLSDDDAPVTVIPSASSGGGGAALRVRF